MLHLRTSLILFFALAASVQAQSDSTHVRHWTLGLNAGAGMGYRKLSNGSSPYSDVIISSRNEREEPRTTCSAVAVAEYRFSRKVGLEAGLGYAQLGWLYNEDFSYLNPRDQSDPSVPNSYLLHRIFHYAEFRIGATLSLGKGRFISISNLGVAPSLLIEAKSRTVIEFADGRTEHDSNRSSPDYERFNLFPYFSTGVAYRSGDRWEWRLQPTVRYGVMQIIDTPVTAHLYSATLDLGVRFAL